MRRLGQTERYDERALRQGHANLIRRIDDVSPDARLPAFAPRETVGRRWRLALAVCVGSCFLGWGSWAAEVHMQLWSRARATVVDLVRAAGAKETKPKGRAPGAVGHLHPSRVPPPPQQPGREGPPVDVAPSSDLSERPPETHNRPQERPAAASGRRAGFEEQASWRQFQEEIQCLEGITRSLQTGRNDEALRSLDAFDERFKDPKLWEEARRLRQRASSPTR